MRISLRILLGYFLLVGIAAWFVLNIFVEEIKPGVRQTTEDALVDTAHVLAQIAEKDLRAGSLQNGALAQASASRSRPVSSVRMRCRRNSPGAPTITSKPRAIGCACCMPKGWSMPWMLFAKASVSRPRRPGVYSRPRARWACR